MRNTWETRKNKKEEKEETYTSYEEQGDICVSIKKFP